MNSIQNWSEYKVQKEQGEQGKQEMQGVQEKIKTKYFI